MRLHGDLTVTFLKAEGKLHMAPNLFEAVILRESWHVILCVFINMPQLSSMRGPQPCVQEQFGLRGGGSGGDPLSVMGQGHTMGALCQICWGCTAVGKGVALISVRMFTGVCHVWKLICSLTFPSHNHLRICISSLEKEKGKWWILPRIDYDFQGQNHRPVIVTTNTDNIFVFAIVSPLYQG